MMRRYHGVLVCATAFKVIAPVVRMAVPPNPRSIVSVPGVVTTVEITPVASMMSTSPGALSAFAGSVNRPCVEPVVSEVRVVELVSAVPAACSATSER